MPVVGGVSIFGSTRLSGKTVLKCHYIDPNDEVGGRLEALLGHPAALCLNQNGRLSYC